MSDAARTPIHISGAVYERPVGKRLERGPDGKSLVKSSSLLERAKGGKIINRMFNTVAEAFEFRRVASATTVFFTGTFAEDVSDSALVVSKRALSRAPIELEHHSIPALVAATKDFLEFRLGAGVICIDIDHKGPDDVAEIWPVGGRPALSSPQEIQEALLEVLPEARACPMFIVPSSSSMIADAETGELLVGPGGWRVWLATADASHTARVLQVVHHRCWAQDKHNYAYVSRGGAVLNRSLVDLALAKPTQPDFPTADLGEGLQKVDGAAIILNAEGPYLDSESVVLTAEDRALSQKNLALAREHLKPTSTSLRTSLKQRDVAAAVVRGIARASAERAAERKFESALLLGSDIVTFADGSTAAVAELLVDGERYNGRTCFDPIEPDYDGGRAVAIFYWNNGAGPVVHSFAHGSRTYALRHDFDTAASTIQRSGSDSQKVVGAIAHAAVDGIENVQLETMAAVELRLGSKRKELRSQVDALRRSFPPVRNEPDGFVDRDGEKTSLTNPIPISEFPVVEQREDGSYRVVDHMDNQAHMLARYGISYRYNVISKKFEWNHSELHSEGDNADEMLFSTLIGLNSLNHVPKENVGTHLTALGNLNSYNPVLEFLQSLNWDGKPRLKSLAATMQADDPAIAEIAVRIFFIQACAAADNGKIGIEKHPEYHPSFESILVLVGAQGVGKTKGARKLLPPPLRKYFKEGGILDVRNKDILKAVLSAWICELGELEGTFKRTDISNLKSFASQQVDEIRAPYARTSSLYRRRTVFLGTVNDVTFLADHTGNRRFLPLTVARVDVGWPDEDLEQVWAEAMHRYSSGETWWATAEEEQLLAENAERYRWRPAVEEKLEEYFDWAGGPDWSTPDGSIRRLTSSAIFEKIYSGARNPDPATQKAIGAAMARLWRQFESARLLAGRLHVQDKNGNWVRLNAESGPKRGWLLPRPRASGALNAAPLLSPHPSPDVCSLSRGVRG